MIGCTLSRFDAHQGVHNATIINSTLKTISLIGSGRVLIDGVTKASQKEKDFGETDFMSLRNDYGATWHGDVIIKNSTVNTNATVTYLIKINHNYNWDYGYQCYMPTTVKISNVTVNYTGSSKKPVYYVFSNLDLTRTLTPEIWQTLKNPLVLTEKVVVRNCKTEFKLTNNQTGMLDNVKFIQK